MIYASDQLVGEHQNILRSLDILEKMADVAETSDEIELQEVQDIVLFLKVYADQNHHGKEEKLLFPAMERKGLRYETGPLGQMLIEHGEGRAFIEAMSRSTEEGTLHNTAFAEAAKSYVALMRAHIQRENQVLFPFGNRSIPEEEQTQLIEEFLSIESKVLQKEIREKMLSILDDLTVKYL